MTITGEWPGHVIHAAKLPMTQPPERLHVRPGTDGVVSTDPGAAGWRYLSFRAFGLLDGETVLVDPPGQESALVTISGGGVEVIVEGHPTMRLPGRRTVFEGMPWSTYLPAGRSATGTASASAAPSSPSGTSPTTSAADSPEFSRRMRRN